MTSPVVAVRGHNHEPDIATDEFLTVDLRTKVVFLFRWITSLPIVSFQLVVSDVNFLHPPLSDFPNFYA